MSETPDGSQPSPLTIPNRPASEDSSDDPRFILRMPGHAEFRTIVGLLTDEQLSRLAHNEEVSSRLSTWRTIMQRINSHKSVSQTSLDWLTMQAEEFMRLIVAKLGYASLKNLSQQLYQYADDLLRDGWPVEMPGSNTNDIVTVENPETSECEKFFWAGPSLIYRAEPSDDDGSDDDGFDDDSEQSDGDVADEDTYNFDKEAMDEDLDPSDEEPWVILDEHEGHHVDQTETEPLPDDIFGYTRVYKYGPPQQVTDIRDQAVGDSLYGATTVYGYPSGQDTESDRANGGESVQPELQTEPPQSDFPHSDTAIDPVSRLAAESSFDSRPDIVTDRTLGATETKKRKRGKKGKAPDTSRPKKKAKKDDVWRNYDYKEKGAIEEPPEGRTKAAGRCLTCIRYKRKCPSKDGIVNGKCWVCRGSPTSGEPTGSNTQQRNCFWIDEEKGIYTYEQAQEYNSSRKIPQNTRAAIAAKRAAEADPAQAEGRYSLAQNLSQSSSSVDSSTAESTHVSAEARLSSASGSTQHQPLAAPWISLATFSLQLTAAQRDFLVNAVADLLSSGLASDDHLLNMEYLITILQDMYERLQTVVYGNTLLPQLHAYLPHLQGLLEQLRVYLQNNYGILQNDIQDFATAAAEANLHASGSVSQF